MITCDVQKHFDSQHTLYTLKVYVDGGLVVSEKTYSMKHLRNMAANCGIELPESIGDMGWSSQP